MRTDVGWAAQLWPGMEHVIVSQEAGGRAAGRLIMAEGRLPIRRLDWSPGQARDLDVAYMSVPDLGTGRLPHPGRPSRLRPFPALA